MTLLTLFAKKEPTTDPVSIQLGMGHKKDTVVYRDAECKEPVGRWPWDYSSCPRRGQRTAMLNCYRWNLSWVQ